MKTKDQDCHLFNSSYILFLCLCFSPGLQALDSLVLQASGEPSTRDYAKASIDLPGLDDFTVCYSVRPYRLHRVMVVASYAVGNSDNEIRIEHTPDSWRLFVFETLISIPYKLVPFMWASFCASVNVTSSNRDALLVTMFVHDTPGEVINATKSLRRRGLRGGGVLILGQDQDTLEGGFQEDQSFTGEIARFGIWSKIFPFDILRQLTRMGGEYADNLIPWLTGWILEGEAKWRVMRAGEETAGSKEDLLQFVGVPFSLLEHSFLCNSLGGTLGVPSSNCETRKLLAASGPWISQCAGSEFVIFMWLNAVDKGHEGFWTSLEGEQLNYTHWYGVEPNGGDMENCVGIRGKGVGKGMWYDIMCDGANLCASCRFTSRPYLRLRGPCVDRSGVDSDYVLHPDSHDGLNFIGFTSSNIVLVEGNYGLVIDGLSPIAFLEEHAITPVGRYRWAFPKADGCPGVANGSAIMVLSACRTDQFTCSTGTCIPLLQRCDRVDDCNDASDEVNCMTMVIPPSYRFTLPPPSIPLKEEEAEFLKSLPDIAAEPLFVYVYVDVSAVTSLSTKDMEFTIEFTMRMTWRDSRLTFHNLNEDENLNLVQEGVDQHWTPEVQFVNGQGNSHTLVDEESRVTVRREAAGVLSRPTYAYEDLEYKGLENSLSMTRKYNVTFNCYLDLMMYPFDKHICTVDLMMASGTRDYLVLRSEGGGGAQYSGYQILVEYEVTGVNMVEDDGTSILERNPSSSPTTSSSNSTSSSSSSSKSQKLVNYSTLRMELHFRRLYGFFLINTFLPTSLMIVIAYLTFFFKVDDFNDRIMVSLTSLLVLSSLFNQSSSSLPKTSYLKMVDVWFLSSIVTIFVIIVIQTFLEHLRDDEQGGGRGGGSEKTSSRPVKIFGRTFPSSVSSIFPQKTQNQNKNKEQQLERFERDFSLRFGLQNKNEKDLEIMSLSSRRATSGSRPRRTFEDEDEDFEDEVSQGQRSTRSWRLCDSLSKVLMISGFVIFLITYFSIALKSYQG